MSAQIAFNPFVVTVGNGLFNTQSRGLRQGTAYPDPATRYALRQGLLDSTETLPMWGGVGVYENIPGAAGGPNPTLGVMVGRATAMTGSKALAGFSVFDQAYNMVTSPQSPVPLAASGNTVLTYALKSRARIAVKCDPALIDLIGDPIGSQVSWDFVNQLLVPYSAAAYTVNATGSGYSAGTVTLKATAALTTIDPGDSIVVSALTGTGADLASANGTFTVLTKPAADTITYAIASGLTIASITGGTITPGSGVGVATLLPVSVLDIQETNCMVVEYDAVTGFATYNYDGCCAVIQI